METDKLYKMHIEDDDDTLQALYKLEDKVNEIVDFINNNVNRQINIDVEENNV